MPRCDLIIPQLPLGITRIDSDTCNEGTIPEEFYLLVALTSLQLVSRKTEGFLPDMIPKLQKLPLLQVLGLGKGTSGTIPEGIGALVALTYLDLGGTGLEGASGPIQIKR